MATAHPTLRLRDIRRPRSDTLEQLSQLERFFYAYSARAALYQLLRAMSREKRNTVLLPAFHCTTVVEPVLRAGFQVRFYRIRQDLSVDLDDLESKLSGEVAVVLLIHFLGFPAPVGEVLRLRPRFGFYLVEDCAHSFLRGPRPHFSGGEGDFTLYSFYKLVPSFAGGGLRICNADFSFPPSTKSSGIRHISLILKRMVEQVADNAGDGFWKNAFQTFEAARVKRKRSHGSAGGLAMGMPYEGYDFNERLAGCGIPWISRKILEASDLKDVLEKRRRNYAFLNQNLVETQDLRKIFTVLPDDVCPWAFPVWLRARSKCDHLMRERGVALFTFGETLHPAIQQCDPLARRDAEDLSQNMLLLSIHQNVMENELRDSCRIIQEVLERGRGVTCSGIAGGKSD
jgi:perosamine synthetase